LPSAADFFHILPTNLGFYIRDWWVPYVVLAGVLGGLALIGAPWMLDRQRKLLIRGLVCTILGSLMLLYWSSILASAPFLRFVRSSYRFVMLVGFGVALVEASALDLLYRRLAGFRGGVLAGLAAVIALAAMGSVLRATALYPIRAHVNRETYRAIGTRVRRAGGGALLELPLVKKGGSLESDSMIGSTYHWLPLLGGFISYQPPHRELFLETVARLPDRTALEDLVDMTHVRWILLRPDRDWPRGRREQFLKGLASSGMAAIGELGAWSLVRLDRTPEHPKWFASLASGTSPGKTILGTPLVPLPRLGRVVRWQVVDSPAQPWPARGLEKIRLRITNAGTVDWPAVPPPRAPLSGFRPHAAPRTAYVVEMTPVWRDLQPTGDAVEAPRPVALWRDVPAGESLEQEIRVRVPDSVGTYHLDLELGQAEGESFESVGEALPVEVR
jgi:hypothetical protein